jgi:hypothetical protein
MNARSGYLLKSSIIKNVIFVEYPRGVHIDPIKYIEKLKFHTRNKVVTSHRSRRCTR